MIIIPSLTGLTRNQFSECCEHRAHSKITLQSPFKQILFLTHSDMISDEILKCKLNVNEGRRTTLPRRREETIL